MCQWVIQWEDLLAVSIQRLVEREMGSWEGRCL